MEDAVYYKYMTVNVHTIQYTKLLYLFSALNICKMPIAYNNIFKHSNQNQLSIDNHTKLLTIHSNSTKTIPLAAPAPARPIKCSLPILLPNMDAPTWKYNFNTNCYWFKVIHLNIKMPNYTLYSYTCSNKDIELWLVYLLFYQSFLTCITFLHCAVSVKGERTVDSSLGVQCHIDFLFSTWTIILLIGTCIKQ